MQGGFTGSKCDECKPNITGEKCNTCEATFYNYPSCQGLSKQLVSIFLKINPILLFQNANVTQMARLLWNVMTMVIALAKMDMLDKNVMLMLLVRFISNVNC